MSGSVVADRLVDFLTRVERLEAEIAAIRSDVKDIYSEAKAAGFDTKVLKAMVRRRRMEPADVEEQDTLLEVYERAVSGPGRHISTDTDESDI